MPWRRTRFVRFVKRIRRCWRRLWSVLHLRLSWWVPPCTEICIAIHIVRTLCETYRRGVSEDGGLDIGVTRGDVAEEFGRVRGETRGVSVFVYGMDVAGRGVFGVGDVEAPEHAREDDVQRTIGDVRARADCAALAVSSRGWKKKARTSPAVAKACANHSAHSLQVRATPTHQSDPDPIPVRRQSCFACRGSVLA